MDMSLGDALSQTRLSRRQALMALLIAALTSAALAVIFVAHLTFLSPLTPAEVSFVENQPSPVRVVAPDRITFVSELNTTHAQDEAAAKVPDVYDPPDAEIARAQVRLATRIMDFMDTIRADPYSTQAEKVEWMMAVPTVTVSADVISGTVALDANAYQQVTSETLYVLDQAMRDEIRSGEVNSAAARLSSRVSLVLSADQADLVTRWAKSFLVANSFYDPITTNAARQKARDEVGVSYRTLAKGQEVVRAGEVVTTQIMEDLKQLGYLQPQDNSQERMAGILLAFLIVLIQILYLAHFSPQLFAQPRILLLLSFLLLGTALGTKVIVPGRSIIPYLFPFAAAAMMGAALLDSATGIGLALVVALSVGYIANGAIDLIAFALVGSVVAVVTLRQRDRLTSFIVSGAYVALANMAVVLILNLGRRDEDLLDLARIVLAAVGSGGLTGLLALGSQFVLGKLAGVTTALELIELARPTHPLLQKLLREAPGTYHHSLVISNLAEHAAQRIGADSLLLRVGAYYHDVGKTMNPQYFAENQFDGVNIHDTLEPHASAAILHQHIVDGLNLTKRYGVSNRVRDLIPQHHGTTLSTYFYDKALKRANGQPVDIEDFRYPGPKPQTREAVIMMLADGVEATSRAERPSNPAQIHAIIDRIIDQRMREGQLDEAPVSLRDLDLIRQAFFDVLQGLYHPRVRYPPPPHLKPREEVIPPSETEAARSSRESLPAGPG
ncbi:MAG: HDIG domain-containing metalloprotein [Anaerolineae bacterium]